MTSHGAGGDDELIDPPADGPAGGVDAEADRAQVEAVLDDVRTACRRVRDAWRELWR